MKSCLTFLGIIFLVLLVVGGAIFGFLAYNGSKFDASSKKYVDDSIPVILASWDEEELMKRAGPELMKVATKAEVTDLFAKLNRNLGHLVEYKGSKGDSNISFTPSTGEVVTATYKAEAQCERGRANIDFRLIQHNGQWQVLQFYVTSPDLMK